MWWNSASLAGPIGLIAGQGEFPLIFAQAASSLKRKVVVFGVKGYTDKRVENFAAQAHYVELGALGQLLELLKREKIKKVVLAGGIPKRQMYDPLFRLDETAEKFIHNARHKGDDHLLKAFQFFLKAKCGVSVVDSRRFLKEILAGKGVLTRRAPTDAEWEDLKFGCHIAKGIGKMDIGQTVVVKEGVVLAIEAIEGTDAAVKRGGSLGQSRAVVVKAAKPGQDLRFDLPCVGLGTLECMKSARCGVLGVESGKTIMLFKDKMVETADKENISIVGL